MSTLMAIRTSPNFDGTMETTSTEANRELGQAINPQAAQVLQKAAPSALTFQVKPSTDLQGVDLTKERSTITTVLW